MILLKRFSLVLIGFVFFLFSYVVLRTSFDSGHYAFDDLGLINDFLSNTVYGRGFFYAPEYRMSHLAVHFTPTLLLLTPFYRLIQSQFLLIGAGLITTYASFFFYLRIFQRVTGSWLPRSARSGWLWWAADLVFLLILAFNPYVKTVLLSAHFEIFYLFFAGWTLYLLVTGARLKWVMLAAFLTFGVRQDAAVYLFFQVVALCLLPRAVVKKRSVLFTHALIVCGFAVLYALLAVKFAMPLLGSREIFHVGRFWGRYGSTWEEVFRGIAHSPLQVLGDLWTSGLPQIPRELHYLPLLSPMTFILTNVPAILLYIASTLDKKFLWYYNSAFILPGLYLACAMGLAFLMRLADYWGRHKQGWAPKLRYAILAFPLWVGLTTLLHFDRTVEPGLNFDFFPVTSDGEHAQALREFLGHCPAAHVVAADFKKFVWIPNREGKRMLDRWRDADAVFVTRDFTAFKSGFTDEEALTHALRADQAWELTQSNENFRIYSRKSLGCGRSGGRSSGT